eukprot:GHUV01007015.1.p1 GENE.GHUV01007015.1~~GHUV01007015.1.p1  ORF type:complete len:262 (+),score=88.64 GHUV01007015.1:557-1342(+)
MRMQAAGATVAGEQDAGHGLAASRDEAGASRTAQQQRQADVGSRSSRMPRGRGGASVRVGPRRQQPQQDSNRRLTSETAGSSNLNSPRRLGTNSGSGSGRGVTIGSTRNRVPAGVRAGVAAMAREELRQRLLAAEQAHASMAVDAASSSSRQTDTKESDAAAANIDWKQIVSKACQRGETECAICLCPLARRQQEAVALLSCSHTFHMQCVVSFEQFEQGRGGRASCPVCRASYVKKCFEIDVDPSSSQEADMLKHENKQS